jgi:hypothetical protein
MYLKDEPAKSENWLNPAKRDFTSHFNSEVFSRLNPAAAGQAWLNRLTAHWR